MAVYSWVPVYEMLVNGVCVMRRRSDSYMNATQILKLAGLDKARRNLIVDRDIIQGEHEKIQGNYGKYQGIWIPFNRALELAKQFGLEQLLAPMFDYLPSPIEPNPASTDLDPVLPALSNASVPTSNHASDHTNPPLIQLNYPPSHQPISKRERPSTSTSATPDEYQPEPGPSKRSRLNTPSHHSNTSDPPAIARADIHHLIDPSFDRLLNRTPTTLPPAQPLLMPQPSSPPALRDPLDPRQEEQVQALVSIFATSLGVDKNGLGDSKQILDTPDLQIDLPIDDQAHTALHWAASLARTSLVADLLKAGAHPMRGNERGETALMRAALMSTCFDERCFDELLELLHPSLCATDHQRRNVLHQICLTASDKARAESSRYYLECLFEWIVRRHEGRFEGYFIDGMDINGDTALNIAARLGDKHLIQMLLDVGASKKIANKLGLDPTDFGVEPGTSMVIPTTTDGPFGGSVAETAVFGTGRPQPPSELIGSMKSLLTSLESDFEDEIGSRTSALERVRAELKTASRALSEQRRELQEAKQELDGFRLVDLRLKKLRGKIEEEDEFDWTGRSEVDGSAARAGKAFEHKGIGSTLVSLSSDQISLKLEPDPLLPMGNSPENLVYLRRMEAWYARVLGLMRERIGLMKGCSLAQEAKYLKVISTFIGSNKLEQPPSGPKTPGKAPMRAEERAQEGKVGLGIAAAVSEEEEGGQMNLDGITLDLQLLNQLMVAIESDGPDLDLHRVAGFMNRVNAGLV